MPINQLGRNIFASVKGELWHLMARFSSTPCGVPERMIHNAIHQRFFEKYWKTAVYIIIYRYEHRHILNLNIKILL